MHRSSRHRRIVAALLAAWFAVVTAEPAALHACPMHGGALHGGALHGATAHGAARAAALPSATEQHHAPHHAPTPPTTNGHQCTCLGHCSTTAGAAMPASSIALVPVVETAATRDRGLPPHEYVPVATAHVLPFANGPPTTAT